MKNLVECFLLRGPSEWVLATGEHEPGQGFAPAAISVAFRVFRIHFGGLFYFGKLLGRVKSINFTDCVEVLPFFFMNLE